MNYFNKDIIQNLGIDLFSEDNVYITKILNDINYFSIYNSDNLNYNLDPNNDYFQTNEITNFIYICNKIKSNIIEKSFYYKNIVTSKIKIN